MQFCCWFYWKPHIRQTDKVYLFDFNIVINSIAQSCSFIWSNNCTSADDIISYLYCLFAHFKFYRMIFALLKIHIPRKVAVKVGQLLLVTFSIIFFNNLQVLTWCKYHCIVKKGVTILQYTHKIKCWLQKDDKNKIFTCGK